MAKWARIVAEEGERARKLEFGVDDSSLLEDEMGETGVFEVLSVSLPLSLYENSYLFSLSLFLRLLRQSISAEVTQCFRKITEEDG